MSIYDMPALADPVAQLRSVMRDRADHAQSIGLRVTHEKRGIMRIWWRDYTRTNACKGFSGMLARIPANDYATVQALLDEIGKLKAEAKRAA